jgi:hypothetical protein
LLLRGGIVEQFERKVEIRRHRKRTHETGTWKQTTRLEGDKMRRRFSIAVAVAVASLGVGLAPAGAQPSQTQAAWPYSVHTESWAILASTNEQPTTHRSGRGQSSSSRCLTTAPNRAWTRCRPNSPITAARVWSRYTGRQRHRDLTAFASTLNQARSTWRLACDLCKDTAPEPRRRISGAVT